MKLVTDSTKTHAFCIPVRKLEQLTQSKSTDGKVIVFTAWPMASSEQFSIRSHAGATTSPVEGR